MKKLSIIVPFGTSEERPFIKDRVIKKIFELKHDDIEAVFVEGYSSDYDPEIGRQIESNGHKYIRDLSQSKLFSTGSCRNVGVQHSTSPVIMFMDVDCWISRRSFDKLLQIIEVKGIRQNPNRFLFIPCIYLKKDGSEYLYSRDESLWDTLVQEDFISNKYLICRFMAFASSSVVMNRHKFLELGGNDSRFFGHGYEDFDFNYRLVRTCAQFQTLPLDLSFDYRAWSLKDYKGFRSLFTVLGFESIYYGFYLCHFWHPEPNQEGYLDRIEINHQQFYATVRNFKAVSDGPDPLQTAEAIGKKVLFLSAENASAYRSVRGVVPYIGDLVCEKEDAFFVDEKLSARSLESFMSRHDISCVLFPNPYGNEKRLEIYNYVREKQVPYICYDRGALPDSWFFDVNGFNVESVSYDETNWNHELDAAQRAEVIEYIDKLKNSKEYLESQGERLGADQLRRKLGVRHKKVVFVPLQVETDTVIKYFTKPGLGFYEFLDILNETSRKLLGSDWVIVAKRHPLFNIDTAQYHDIIFAPINTNLSDMLELSDIVLTINSGVGVYAMIYEKPCMLAGHAFYRIDGVNTEVSSEDEILEFIRADDHPFDREKMLRFVHYLYRDFYSFGKSTYSSFREGDVLRRVVNRIDFYQINIGGRQYLAGNSADTQRVNDNSPLLYPYRTYLKDAKLAAAKPAPAKPAPAKPAPAKPAAAGHGIFYRLAAEVYRSIPESALKRVLRKVKNMIFR